MPVEKIVKDARCAVKVGAPCFAAFRERPGGVERVRSPPGTGLCPDVALGCARARNPKVGLFLHGYAQHLPDHAGRLQGARSGAGVDRGDAAIVSETLCQSASLRAPLLG